MLAQSKNKQNNALSKFYYPKHILHLPEGNDLHTYMKDDISM